jgi:VanZ family protein
MRQWLHKLQNWTKTIWPAMIWSAFIFVLLIIPNNQLPNEGLIPIPHFDKLVHFILFGAFAYLWNSYLSQLKIFAGSARRFGVILFAILIYGLLLEFLQLYTGRNFDWYDILADSVGVLFIKKPGLFKPGLK